MSLRTQQQDLDEYILLIREQFINSKNNIINLALEKRIKELEVKHPEYLED